jgi:hypothetical protein
MMPLHDDRYIYHIDLDPRLCHYDCTSSVVVIARDSKVARTIAASAHGDEGALAWHKPASSKLTKLGLAKRPNGRSPARERVVCRDFNVG